MVSKVYEGINIDYINTMSHMASIVFEAKALEANLEKDETNAKFTKYPSILPDRDDASSISRMYNLMRDTRSCMGTMNKNCVSDCSDKAIKTTPIALSVPQRKICSDEDIKKCYDELRQVLHDEFTSVEEGGEGWVKFIDTLVTPEERAENYKIPSFDSVYNQFMSDKKITAVSKEDIKKAIKTISEYDKQMGQIIKEAEEYSLERNKEVQLLSMDSGCETFEECMKHLAHAMYIVEQDHLASMSYEARRVALIEACNDAHELLYSVCIHDPRSLKESSILLNEYLPIINESFIDIIYDPKVPSVTVSESEQKIDKIVKKIADINDDFITKNEEKVKLCSGKGIFADIVSFSPDVVGKYHTIICAEEKALGDLSSMQLEAVSYVTKSINALRRAMKDNSTACLEGYSIRDSFGLIKDMLFTESGEMVSSYNGIKSFSASLMDIYEAVSELKNKKKVEDKANIAKKIISDKKDAVKKGLEKVKKVVSDSSKSKEIKKAQTESNLFVSELYDRYITEYVDIMKADNYNAISIVCAAARTRRDNETIVELGKLYDELKDELLNA